jgi:5-methylcytosine-specific restriction enzyme A
LNAATQRKVLQRDGGACWHCGETEAISIHHRKNRAMGGSKILDRLDNLIVVCSAYNLAMESTASVAEQARERGHKLSSWENFDTPILDIVRGQWFILTLDGKREPAAEPEWMF